MDDQFIIKELLGNRQVFNDLLSGLHHEQTTWRSAPEKWCLLEIICHLVDEEKEDFRARLKHVLETPGEPLPSIDPVGWVKERKYMEQDYREKLRSFLDERSKSVAWLESLANPKWDHAYMHPKFGAMTAAMFLANWLAHDYLHFRQIIRLKFDYLKYSAAETLTYAGTW